MTCFTVKESHLGILSQLAVWYHLCRERGRRRERERISQVWLWEEASPYVTERVLIRTCWKSHADSDHNLQTHECDLLSAAAVESTWVYLLRYCMWGGTWWLYATLYFYSITFIWQLSSVVSNNMGMLYALFNVSVSVILILYAFTAILEWDWLVAGLLHQYFYIVVFPLLLK